MFTKLTQQIVNTNVQMDLGQTILTIMFARNVQQEIIALDVDLDIKTEKKDVINAIQVHFGLDQMKIVFLNVLPKHNVTLLQIMDLFDICIKEKQMETAPNALMETIGMVVLIPHLLIKQLVKHAHPCVLIVHGTLI